MATFVFHRFTKNMSSENNNNCTSSFIIHRILKLNGEVISKTLLSKDTYDPMQRIVRKGTKKIVQETVTEPVENIIVEQ